MSLLAQPAKHLSKTLPSSPVEIERDGERSSWAGQVALYFPSPADLTFLSKARIDSIRLPGIVFIGKFPPFRRGALPGRYPRFFRLRIKFRNHLGVPSSRAHNRVRVWPACGSAARVVLARIV